jgi:hypothetical protein
MLVTDAYGGRGGIAAYNRDAAAAICDDPMTDEVVAIARYASSDTGTLPHKLEFLVPKGGGAGYVSATLRQLLQRCFDLIYCAHINLAPLALAASRVTRTPWLLATYGIEAWRPSPRRSVAFAASRADHVLSISRVTLERFLKFASYPPDRTSIAHNAIHLDRFELKWPNPALV